MESPISLGTSLKSCPARETSGLEGQQAGVMGMDESLSPASLDSVVMAAERHVKSGKYTSTSPINSVVECLDADELIQDVYTGEHEDVFTGTPYVPVYVKLTNGIINNYCQLVDRDGAVTELSHIKSLNADGVVVDCWWGIVEAWNPQKYVWSGYRELFNIILEFNLKIQCYDKYLQQNLRKAAKLRGHSFWERIPDNAGQYNSRPHETGFFCKRGDYDSYYGRFFLHWYAQTLVDHADNVLSLSNVAFEDTRIIVKVPAVYWWYRTCSHAAELTAGYYNPTNQDGYSPVFEVLKKHSVTMKFVCSGLPVLSQENDESLADPEGLSWQVLNSAWDRGLSVTGENAPSCYDREGYITRVIEMAKPQNDPDHHHFAFFVFQQPSPPDQRSFSDMDFVIKSMHGQINPDVDVDVSGTMENLV
ncbi:hypothetical protein SAY86_000637 [Trapa natans]|uniref:Beta-amylase n=1 Tax=Trapa natans TaxID=22666 RepID=A0AAN7MB96_TRANT|nr:hypothetical protein SAY86_000637 [Trapa natans]